MNAVRDEQENPTTKQTNGRGWYARLSEEKKAEYIHKQRVSRAQKKAETLAANAH